MQARDKKKRHLCILLDVDDTLVSYKDEYAHGEKIIFTGGRALWYNNLRALKQAAAKYGVEIHYGIATAKHEFKNLDHKNQNLKGDIITGQILENPAWDKLHGVSSENQGLRDLIDPNLVYYLGEKIDEMAKSKSFPAAYCKALHALELARQYLEKTYHTEVKKRDVGLLDDRTEITRTALWYGYNAICVYTMAKSPLQEQTKIINTLFNKLLREKLHTSENIETLVAAMTKPSPTYFSSTAEALRTFANTACQIIEDWQSDPLDEDKESDSEDSELVALAANKPKDEMIDKPEAYAKQFR
jgi:hypothetical protein